MMMKRLLIGIILLLALSPMQTVAHSGGTDGNGGHTDSRDGSYHKHNSGDSGSSSGELHWNNAATAVVVAFIIFVGVVLAFAWIEEDDKKAKKNPSPISNQDGTVRVIHEGLLTNPDGQFFYVGSKRYQRETVKRKLVKPFRPTGSYILIKGKFVMILDDCCKEERERGNLYCNTCGKITTKR